MIKLETIMDLHMELVIWVNRYSSQVIRRTGANPRNKKEWNLRLQALKSQIQYWTENQTEKVLEIVELFY